MSWRKIFDKNLTEPKNALVNQYKKLFDMEGCELEFRADALSAIGEKSNEKEDRSKRTRTLIESLLLDNV